MLNNEKLWTLSEEFARLLLQYEAGAGKMKRDRTNQVGQLFASVSVKQFLNNLIPIIENEKEVEGYRNMGKVFHEIPKDNFPYFNTLIRFQYALLWRANLCATFLGNLVYPTPASKMLHFP